MQSSWRRCRTMNLRFGLRLTFVFGSKPMRQEVVAVASETVSVSITIKAPTDAIFAVLVDPAKHVAIDGTGWVIESLDRQPLTSSARFRSNTEA
jgi:hypothetical protein